MAQPIFIRYASKSFFALFAGGKSALSAEKTVPHSLGGDTFSADNSSPVSIQEWLAATSILSMVCLSNLDSIDLGFSLPFVIRVWSVFIHTLSVSMVWFVAFAYSNVVQVLDFMFRIWELSIRVMPSFYDRSIEFGNRSRRAIPWNRLWCVNCIPHWLVKETSFFASGIASLNQRSFVSLPRLFGSFQRSASCSLSLCLCII